MGRPANNPPALQEWLDRTGRRSAPQYASSLRPLLRVLDIDSATQERLVDYVVAQSTPRMQRKAVTALVAFFGDITQSGRIARDPAHGLAQAVRNAANRATRRAALLRTGMPAGAVGTLRWRSVAARLVGPDPSRTEAVLLDDSLGQQLQAELLAKLGITAQRFNEIMDEPIT
jgi:hypothetical protein